MASLYTQQDSNVSKTWMLMIIFLVIIIAIGWTFSEIYQSTTILYGAIIFSLLMNIGSYWFSDKVALSVSGAKPANKDAYPELWNVTENLCITAGLPMPKLYIINDPAPNAFATGRNKEHAAVAVTSGLLSMMERNELEGVIAHELSHVKNKDILLSTVVVVLVGFISLLAHFFMRSSLFGFGRRDNDGEGSSGNMLMIVGIILSILSPIVATLIQLAISRKREFLADASGALLTRYPEGLASALQKIAGYSRPMIRANNATAHLFISNPFGGGAKKISNLFMTHPPVEERIKALLNQ